MTITTNELEVRILNDLHKVAIPRHLKWDPLGLMVVRDFVKSRMSLYGTLEEQRFLEDVRDPGTNYILRLPGKNSNLSPLLIGAHYDGPLNSPGADDNASALVALLELARFWSVHTPNRPIWLVAFDQEEWGMLGSQYMARELRNSGQNLKMMVSLEMLAYTSDTQRYPVEGMERVFGTKGDYIALVSNAKASNLAAKIGEKMGGFVKTKALPVPNFGESMPSVRMSDHSPFWDTGFDAMMVTDTAYMRNPNYHKETDTVDTLDIPFMANVIRGLARSLGEI